MLCRLDLEPASLLTERPPLRPTLLVSAPAVYMYVRLLCLPTVPPTSLSFTLAYAMTPSFLDVYVYRSLLLVLLVPACHLFSPSRFYGSVSPTGSYCKCVSFSFPSARLTLPQCTIS